MPTLAGELALQEPASLCLPSSFVGAWLGRLLMNGLNSAIENGPFLWQDTQFYSVPVDGVNSYYQFCDYIEVGQSLTQWGPASCER